MQFPQSFVPTAGQVGVLAMVVEFLLSGAVFAFFGASLFFLATRNQVAPRHRAAAALAAVIVAVAGLSYWGIESYYHDMLHQLAATEDPAARRKLVHDAYLAIGQYRHMDWIVTAPLLLLKIALVLKVKPREMAWPIFGLMAAGLWTVFASFIGEQQLGSDGAVLIGRRCLWGVLATLGFAAIPAIFFLWLTPRFGGARQDEEGRAFRFMVWLVVGSWGVYALGYLAPALSPHANLNWLHVALTAADLIDKIGIGAAAYLVGAAELERRVPHEAIQSSRIAG
jgi:sensory rhodopsin